MQALPQYDVEQLFVCAQSLSARGLQVDDLVLEVQPMSLEQQRELFALQDAVVND